MIKGLLYIAIFFPILYGCNKICTPRDYEFNGGIANVYPDKDSIQIGDTLWFSCYIPVNLKYFVANASDSENYNISSATNFNTDFHLTSPTGVNMQVGAMDSFSFVSKIGKVQMNPLAPDASQTISFATNDSAYLASFGIIARKKGIYFLGIIDIYQGMKKCDKFSVVITMNDADNHLYYLKDIYYGGGPISPLDSTRVYCFKVD
jgi:hypothetical protein